MKSKEHNLRYWKAEDCEEWTSLEVLKPETGFEEKWWPREETRLKVEVDSFCYIGPLNPGRSIAIEPD